MRRDCIHSLEHIYIYEFVIIILYICRLSFKAALVGDDLYLPKQAKLELTLGGAHTHADIKMSFKFPAV